jgi:hypothetical protein
MRCLRYVTVLHDLGRGLSLFGPVCCLDFFGQGRMVSMQVCRILEI